MEELMTRLEAIDAKLDYVVERQRYVEELIEEMTPVAREAAGSMAARMADWERRGWFAMGSELLATLDRLSQAYTAEELRELSENVVQVVDTIRHVTRPEVLELANEATDVLQRADRLPPVGMFAAVKATGDDDVKRGMAVALEILRHLGRAHGERPAERAPEAPAKATPARVAPRAAEAAPRPEPACAPAAPPAGPTVEWEGATFSAEGFLVDPAEWSEELAAKMAKGLGIDLTEEHWTVVRWVREDWRSHGASPNVRRVAAGSGVGTRRMYELFPKTPGKSAAMIAGVPKPAGCV